MSRKASKPSRSVGMIPNQTPAATPPAGAAAAAKEALQPSSPSFFFSSAAAANPSAGYHRRIAIAIDLSDESAYAVKWAVQNYFRPGDAVILLHVRPTSVLYGAEWGSIFFSVSSAEDPASEELQQKLEEHFDAFTTAKAEDLAQPIVEAQIPFKIHIVKGHDMKERLCQEVERLGLSAVIMGSRGFGASKRTSKGRLGSVSDYCVHNCVCPVVVVRYPDEGASAAVGAGGVVDGGSPMAAKGSAEKVAELHSVPEEDECHDASSEYKEMENQELKVAKKGTPNKRWESSATVALIEFLADQVRAGLKPAKQFKKPTLVAAAQYVNDKFSTDFTCHNVENRLRTLKLWHKDIKGLLSLSGASWDDVTRKIKLEPETAKAYCQAHTAAKQFIGNPIPYFDDLQLVCGDDQTIGSFAKFACEEFGDRGIGAGERMMDEEVSRLADHEDSLYIDADASESHSRPSGSHASQKRHAGSQSSDETGQKKKRLKEGDMVMTQLIEKVGEVAKAIKSINIDWSVEVHGALWAFKGKYPNDMLDQAYRFLKNDQCKMTSFVLRNEELKRKWLDTFKDKKYLPGGNEFDDF